MAEFNYIEYLRNNPLLKSEGKQSLTENQRPGYHPDGTPKSNAEMDDDEREEFYLNLDDVSEEKASTKMKVSELKVKIKEDIISLLQEKEEDYINPGNTEEEAKDREEYLEKFGIPPHMRENEESDLESELMAQLDEAKEDEEEDVDVDVEDEVEMDDEIEAEPAAAPVVGLTPEEQQVQDSLKTAYDNAVAMGDEKLADQIGNSITFFTRTHVVER